MDDALESTEELGPTGQVGSIELGPTGQVWIEVLDPGTDIDELNDRVGSNECRSVELTSTDNDEATEGTTEEFGIEKFVSSEDL